MTHSSSLSRVGRNTITYWFLSSKSLQDVPVPGEDRNICLDVFSVCRTQSLIPEAEGLTSLGFWVSWAKPGGSNFTEFGLGRHQQRYSQWLPRVWVPAAKEQVTPENVGRVKGLVEDSPGRRWRWAQMGDDPTSKANFVLSQLRIMYVANTQTIPR